jgi:hypothetical protein
MAKLGKTGKSRGKAEQGLRIAVKLKNLPRKRIKELGALNGLGKPGGTFRLLPLIESLTPGQLAELIEKAHQMDPDAELPDFSSWHQIICPARVHPDDLVKELRRRETVETAYVMRPVPPPLNPSNRNPNQGYLDTALSGGIDALSAWGFPGGDGAGIGFVDMEQGWNLDHLDLAAAKITLISGINQDFFRHGTSVLGEVLMVDNADAQGPIGGLGIAPAASGRVVSQWRTAGSASPNNADAIVSAIASMKFGDVLLLEAQDFDPDPAAPRFLWPVEIADATYDAILLATALGIVVVEAGADGFQNLDTYQNSLGKKIFDRNSTTDFRDSGAIMVGAGTSAYPHTPVGATNQGNRIDCYAWGENIYTTDTDDATGKVSTYRFDFGQTSGASAIVAGAALIVQGMAQASLGYRFSPRALRQLLKTNGTPLTNGVKDVIGVMPNLGGIITTKQLNLAPDLYLRDYVGDTGDPTTGIVSQSPDIIVRQAAVANPQGSYGAGSGTENDPGLSQDVAAGQPNFLYVRLLNRGGSVANAVSVDLYWSPPATLVTPNLWTKIGTAAIPSVPTGNVLTVSGGVAWQNPPGPGHYCFVAVAGNTEDPKPGFSPSTVNQFFSTIDEYITFVENNNNVVWRNFNVVAGPPLPGPPSPEPPSPRGFYSMPFFIPGAFDTGHTFELEALGCLPERSRALLEIPDWLAGALRNLPSEVERNPKTRTARIPLNPFGLQRLGSVMLHVGSRAQCKLLVQLPEEGRQHAYEFTVRQLYHEREVGRITWRFAALRKENLRKEMLKAA